ncbi:cytochrome P450 2C9-like [Branchiostoma floridae]|uniref:Cytochrome P450 2C9-like n=1 Tax=Branchiostoma floridae TaxID=7739 RepID=A0A9J7MEH5_BRAFL|nr:cytochrome P450 2C9-like [Branchiostoma floridae]
MGHRFLTMTEWAKTYGPVYRIQLGKETMIVLSEYDIIHEALVKRGEDFSSRSANNPLVKLTNPKRIGIIYAPFGTPWKEHRKFTLMSLREFGFGKRSLEGNILEESVALQAEIMKMVNKPFDICRMVQNAVTNVICSIVFGSRFEYNDDKFKRLMDALNQVASTNILGQLAIFFPILRRFPGLGRGAQVIVDTVRTIKAYIREEMDSHKKTFDSNDIRDFIDSYVRETKSRENDDETTFTDEYTERVLFDLFIAGSETTHYIMIQKSIHISGGGIWLLLLLLLFFFCFLPRLVLSSCLQMYETFVVENRKRILSYKAR